MCLHKKKHQKEVHAPHFPPGWRFTFEYFNEGNMPENCHDIIEQNNGLVMFFAPGSYKKHYYSAEKAATRVNRAKNDVDVAEFKKYVGLLPSAHHTDKAWLVPDNVVDEMVEDREHQGTYLPRRTLDFRGYEIRLQVKQSSIPNAGYGVFISCKPFFGASNPDALVLQPDEKLDLGVYAPLQEKDRIPDSIHLVKNFIHGWCCESYSFDASSDKAIAGKGGEAWGETFDITDDFTGDLHELARRSVLTYVNESVPGAETVFAKHHPSGALHYVLGQGNPKDGNFKLLADGKEVEIFINYG